VLPPKAGYARVFFGQYNRKVGETEAFFRPYITHYFDKFIVCVCERAVRR